MIVTIEKQLGGLVKSALEKIGAELRQVSQNRLIEYQVEEYKRCLWTKTLLHRLSPVKLNEIYVPLHITNYDPSLAFDEKGREIYLSYIPFVLNEKTSDRKIETRSVRKLFRGRNFITLIGYAGSGKSTLVNYLFLNSIDEKYKIPIKVELRNLNMSFRTGEKEVSLLKYIEDKIFKFQNLAEDESIIERLLDSGKFIFFFDGFDELNSDLSQQIVAGVEQISSRFNKNDYLITTRPYTSVKSLPNFYNYWVCDLSLIEIEEFISKQKLKPEITEKIIQHINTTGDEPYMAYLQNPLLLTMFILTYVTYPNIPLKKHLYYRQVVEALFLLHDSVSKTGFEREMKSGLEKDDFEAVLMTFSFISFFDQRFSFDYQYLKEKFGQVRKINEDLSFSIRKYVDDLLVSIGVFMKDGNYYSFIHRSLQEYFTSLYIAKISEKGQQAFFSDLLDVLFSNSKSFSVEYTNFYNLVSEMNPVILAKFFEIPFLERLAKHHKQRVDRSSFHNFYLPKIGNLRLILKSPLRVRLNTSDTKNRYYIEVEFKEKWWRLDDLLDHAKDIKNQFIQEKMNSELSVIKYINMKND